MKIQFLKAVVAVLCLAVGLSAQVTPGTPATGGSGAWGGITGTLSDQTDLQSAFDLKAARASPTFTGIVTLPATGTILGTPASGVATNLTGLPEAGLTLADNTTANATTSNHGFLLKLNNSATQFVNGQGAWATPAGAAPSYPVTVGGTVTSGGVPYFSSTTVSTSSALLTANSPVLGGGAGAAPSTVAGLTFDGTHILTLSVAGSGAGTLALSGNTSGTATFTAPAIAGTSTNGVVSSNNIYGPAGASNAPTFGFSTDVGGSGLYNVGGAILGVIGSVRFTTTAFPGEYTAGSALIWASDNSFSSFDTSLKRGAAGVLQVGTSTAAGFDGTIKAATHINSGLFGSVQTDTSAVCETVGAATTLATGAATTDTGLNCLPANAIIDAVVYRITTAITTSANFTIGDATIAGRFCGTQSTLTVNTTGICFVQADQTGTSGPRQTAAAAVRVTLNANPGAGAIRLITYYHTWTAPTS